ncbi:MAG: mechanosensitive ion channel [Polyangiaceae bacterium]|nr:mechanosensitive ion channel [Polyangiaceae bacterium]
MNSESFVALKNEAISMVLLYAPQLALAIFTLVVGLFLIRGVLKVLSGGLNRAGVDPTLAPFLSSIIGWGLKLILLISVASMVGIQTTSFVAVMGAAGLAVGLALQGSLSNFAGGVLILLFRPYRVGDFIKAQGEMGTVKEIQIFNTILMNPENRRVIVPNGAIANGNITNYSCEEYVRVDTTVGIAYDADMKKARELLSEMVRKIPGVLEEPAPDVAIAELGDSSVNLIVRPYCAPSDYWSVRFQLIEETKNTLDAANISIPFPQRDIHLFNEK